MGTGVSFNTGNAQSFSEAMEIIMSLMPILIPLMLVQLGLMIVALVHAAKATKFKTGNKIMWIVIIILVDIIGPVLYFVLGRDEPTEGEDDYDERT